MSYTVIQELIGKYITKIDLHNIGDGNDHIDFHISDGAIYSQYHEHDCCESVSIEDIDGSIED